jgi:hypothetical protein
MNFFRRLFSKSEQYKRGYNKLSSGKARCICRTCNKIFEVPEIIIWIGQTSRSQLSLSCACPECGYDVQMFKMCAPNLEDVT